MLYFPKDYENNNKVKDVAAHITVVATLFGGIGILMFDTRPDSRSLGFFMIGLVVGAALNRF